LLLAAAARLRSERPQTKVIIRSVGKGGRRILGIDQGDHAIEGLFRNLDNSLSLHYRNLISTIQTTVKSGKEVGIPISQIYLVWIHGESDRALSVDEYIQLLCELIASVGAEIAPLNVPVQWLTVQPGGTSFGGDGNAWPNRNALQSTELRDIAPMVACGHVLPYFDQSHYSAEGKIVLGEWLGHVLAQYEKGSAYVAPRTPRGLRSDQGIELWFTGNTHPLDPSEPLFGFDILANRQPVDVVEATVVGPDKVRISGPFLDVRELQVNYAFARNVVKDRIRQPTRAYGNGNLFTTYSTNSVLRPGAILREAVPGFSISVSDVA
jgi:hypothetical protein